MISRDVGASPPFLPPEGRGFRWWYVDLCTGPGEGVVLIWARGLPFVPDHPGRASELAIALSAYRDGREHFYALDTSEASVASETADTLTIGRSRFSVTGGEGRTRVVADLDLSIEGSGRVAGRIEVEGPTAVVPDLGVGPLAWAPVVLKGAGRVDLGWRGGSVRGEGRAYVDGNASSEPLETLGIDDWRWGRLAFPRQELVWFRLERERGLPGTSIVLTADDRGQATLHRGATVDHRDGSIGLYGLRRSSSLRLAAPSLGEVAIHFRHRVDDGPFYQRYLVEARGADGATGLGVAERIAVPRLSAAWHRPLVEMRIQRGSAPRSMWLPLFSGARDGRVGRLLASMVRRQRTEAA
jgi:hypothetical protein